jgi:hypothetical protein
VETHVKGRSVTILKIVAFVVFIAACYVTILWHTAAERGLTKPQRSAFGFAALFGWVLTFALAAMA